MSNEKECCDKRKYKHVLESKTIPVNMGKDLWGHPIIQFKHITQAVVYCTNCGNITYPEGE